MKTSKYNSVKKKKKENARLKSYYVFGFVKNGWGDYSRIRITIW